MRAAREDRLESNTGSGRFPLKHVLLVLAIIAVGVVLWRMLGDQSNEVVPTAVPVAEVVVEAAPLPPAEDIPQRPAPVATAEVPAEAAPALPTLGDSDAMARDRLAAAGIGPKLDRLAQQPNLVQQSTALIDGFSRGLVLRKLLPVDPPQEVFSVVEQDGKLLMNPVGYNRYNDYAEAIANLDAAVLVNSFHTMRPLFEQAYGDLGLNPDDFDNALIRMLDRILATPEIEGPIALTRKSVMYQYADPQLEELAPLQKQLLRMGPENIRRIKAQARALRDGLLSPQ